MKHCNTKKWLRKKKTEFDSMLSKRSAANSLITKLVTFTRFHKLKYINIHFYCLQGMRDNFCPLVKVIT
jgi:hypothetical protein